MMHGSRTNQSWCEIGKQQGIRDGKVGGEVQRHAGDFADENKNAAWIDGALEGVLPIGARIAAVTSVLAADLSWPIPLLATAPPKY
jgi:hypothetical protein